MVEPTEEEAADLRSRSQTDLIQEAFELSKGYFLGWEEALKSAPPLEVLIIQLHVASAIYLFGHPDFIYCIEDVEQLWIESCLTPSLPHLHTVGLTHTINEELSREIEDVYYEGSSRVWMLVNQDDSPTPVWSVQYSRSWSDAWQALMDSFGDENHMFPSVGHHPRHVPASLFGELVENIRRCCPVSRCLQHGGTRALPLPDLIYE